ncbi:MAG: hypothetical protein WKF82_03095 [Nocardioidaceae bacterium]
MTASVYATDESVIDEMRSAALDVGVALSENLTGPIFVNQSSAFSDFHGTGANPASNATFTDGAYVASRFRFIQSRRHHPERLTKLILTDLVRESAARYPYPLPGGTGTELPGCATCCCGAGRGARSGRSSAARPRTAGSSSPHKAPLPIAAMSMRLPDRSWAAGLNSAARDGVGASFEVLWR